MNKTPKEKAKQLFNQYHNLIQEIGGDMGHEILVSILAKQSCLIAVDEIIKATKPLASTYFWQEVKEEINNL
jgi:hypothetical protein